MPDQSDVREISPQGDVSKKRRFDARDWDYIAEQVIDDYNTRKDARKDIEKSWKEIDRQVAMQPDVEFKKLPNGEIDPNKAWMSEVEMPLQAQALEVLTADCRRMMFSDDGTWFTANAEVTDDYLKEVDLQSIILGDETEVPSQINQDNADKLVHGFCLNQFDQGDFFTRYDRIDAEAIKYGMGVGRGRMETKTVFIHEARGVRKENQRIPVLVPCSIKNTYLDNPKPSMHSAQVLGDTIIAKDYIKYENLMLAANRGSTDPNNEDGGWMPANLKKVEPDNKGYVTILEIEGDIVVPRKTTRSLVIPGAIATIVMGGEKGGKSSHGVIRFRFRKYPFSSYLLHPYHYEGADDAYPTSPLMKGRPIQIMASQAINRLLDSAALKCGPPVGWDRTDTEFASQGGPQIYPFALWRSIDPNSIKAHTEVGGDPSQMAGALTLAIQLYAELTGVLPARLGAQTKSHTTAFAKDREIERGAARTVDYVKQVGQGPLVRWLDMAYRMGRDTLGSRDSISFPIPAYGGFVEVNKKQLPERAHFKWLGSGGPVEEAQRLQRKAQSLQIALQMDQLNVAYGGKPNINVAAGQREILRDGGWSDLDVIIEAATSALSPNQNVGPGPAVAALQQLGVAAE